MVATLASAISSRLRRYTGRRATVASGIRLPGTKRDGSDFVLAFTKRAARTLHGTDERPDRRRRGRRPCVAGVLDGHVRTVAGPSPPPRAGLERLAPPLRPGVGGAGRGRR